MPLVFGAQGVTPSLRGQATTVITLEAGAATLIPPGAWMVGPGKYTALQEFDPVTGIWRNIGADTQAQRYLNSDGVNFRLANQTGCVVGALITNAGTLYTSAPVITASAGNAVFTAIVGGAMSTVVTVTNGGANYTYPPQVWLSSPGNPGIQATGYCTISGGAVTTVTVTDQGAGYTTAPIVNFINDPRDSTGYNAAATTVLTGAGTVTGVLVTDHGTPLTATPTLAFAGGGGSAAAATAIMCYTITAYTVTSAGSGYVGAVEVTALGGFPATAPAYTNPTTQANLVRTRKASILAALSTGTVTATSQVVYDGGIYPGVPAQLVIGSFTGTSSSVANVGFAVGGVADTSLLIAA